MTGLRRRLRVRRGRSAERRTFAVDAQDRDSGPGEVLRQLVPRHHQRGARVGEHEGPPLRRVDRVQRQIGAARLEDRQHRHDQLRRPWQAEPHHHIRPDAQAPQVMRQPVGLFIQTRIAQAPPLRAGSARCCRATARPAVRTAAPGSRHFGYGPADGRPAAMIRRRSAGGRIRSRPTGDRRIAQDAVHQFAEVIAHPPDACRHEKVGVVGEVGLQAAVAFLEGERQVELGGS